MKTVGLITIGQSPRDDIVPEMAKLLGPEIGVLEAGALDGLSRDQVAGLAPGPGQDALVTRLRDGTEVVIAKQAILGLLQGCLDRLAPRADAFVILCTGAFPPFRCSRPVLEPDRILFATVRALFREGTLGVLIPIAAQRESATARWSQIASRLAIAVASPYQGPAALVRAAEELGRAGASLVVLDCMGNTQAIRETVRDITGVPVLLPASLVARLVAEVI